MSQRTALLLFLGAGCFLGCVINKDVIPAQCDPLDCSSSCGQTQPYCAAPDAMGIRAPMSPCSPAAVTDADLLLGTDPADPVVWSGDPLPVLNGAVGATSDEWIRLALVNPSITLALRYVESYSGVVLGAYEAAGGDQPLVGLASGADGTVALTIARPPGGVLYLRIRNNASAAICYALSLITVP